jgi:small nuclear ribonucleoprotein (snRNP)-like protein
MSNKRFGFVVEARNRLTISQSVTIRLNDGTEVPGTLIATQVGSVFIRGEFQVVIEHLTDALMNKGGTQPSTNN